MFVTLLTAVCTSYGTEETNCISDYSVFCSHFAQCPSLLEAELQSLLYFLSSVIFSINEC